MKKIYFIIMLMLFLPQIVLAMPNASISVNASFIENGKSVTATVTLTDVAAWNIKIVGSGAATCSTKQADVTSDAKSTTKTFTLKCASTTEGVINFNVTGDITSGSGQTKDISLTKSVNVTKPKSSDNSLSSIMVDGVTVSGFSSDKTSYTLKDNSLDSIKIEATPKDANATVSGTGSKKLKYGKNTFGVTVTAENGSKKTYNIIVNKPDPRSKNNDLKSLSVNVGAIDFNKDTTSYLIKVEHGVNDVTINAVAEDAKATVTGTGTKVLKDYVNEFKIVVKAENETTKTYVIKVARKDAQGNFGKLSKDNTVKSISITNYDFKFNKDIKEYNILVDEDVDEVEIKVTPNDNKSSVTISNNSGLKSGLNKVNVIVTAENGDKNEYLFKVYKIGEEENVVPTNEEQDNKECEKVEDNNLWKIISGIEFVIVILLMVLLLKKKKTNNNKDTKDLNLVDNSNINVNNNTNNTNNTMNTDNSKLNTSSTLNSVNSNLNTSTNSNNVVTDSNFNTNTSSSLNVNTNSNMNSASSNYNNNIN